MEWDSGPAMYAKSALYDGVLMMPYYSGAPDDDQGAGLGIGCGAILSTKLSLAPIRPGHEENIDKT